MKKSRWLLLLMLVAVCPALMGPETIGCPSCTVAYGSYNVHGFTVDDGVAYEFVVTLASGNANLTVTGSPVSALYCWPSGSKRTCTFIATADGQVNSKVSGAPGPATYSLIYYWD